MGGVGVLELVLLYYIGIGGAERLGEILRKKREEYLYIKIDMLGMIVLVFLYLFYGVEIYFKEEKIYKK